MSKHTPKIRELTVEDFNVDLTHAVTLQYKDSSLVLALTDDEETARLIAVAPEMLRLLKQIASLVPKGYGASSPSLPVNIVDYSVHAGILVSKAEGRGE